MSPATTNPQTSLARQSIEERVAQIEKNFSGQGLRPLIQQVAWVLFFEYEKLPTGNNIYALLKQGSMTTYGSEVNVFWDNLREQVREAQSLANIPEPLASEISRSINGLWRLALDVASESGKRNIKKDEKDLDFLTPLSRLSARMEAIKTERNVLRERVENTEKLRIERDFLEAKLVKKQAEHEKDKQDFSKKEKKLQKELENAKSKLVRHGNRPNKKNDATLPSPE